MKIYNGHNLNSIAFIPQTTRGHGGFVEWGQEVKEQRAEVLNVQIGNYQSGLLPFPTQQAILLLKDV